MSSEKNLQASDMILLGSFQKDSFLVGFHSVSLLVKSYQKGQRDRAGSMIFRISWAADLSRSGTV